MAGRLSAAAMMRARLTHLIDQKGWAVVATPGSALTPCGIVYTVGLAEAGATDMAVLGLPSTQGFQLLDEVWDAVRERGLRLGDGDHLPPGIRPHGLMFRVVHRDLLDVPALFSQALNYYGRAVPFLQAVWPDASGAFPGDPACSAAVAAAQPDLSLQLARPGA